MPEQYSYRITPCEKSSYQVATFLKSLKYIESIWLFTSERFDSATNQFVDIKIST